MKSGHYIFICIILITLNIFILLRSESYRTDRENCLSDKAIKDIFYEKTHIEKENENLEFPKDLPIYSLTGDKVELENILSRKILVFRLSTINCSVCVNNEIEIISNELHKFSKLSENFIFLVSHSGISEVIDISRKLSSFSVRIPIYSIPFAALNIPLEKQDIPFYFTVDETGRMKDFMIPFKERPDWTIFYFESVSRCFYTSN